MTNEKLSAEKQLALIRYALTTAQKVCHGRFCDPHPLGQAEVCKATSEAITLLDDLLATVRAEEREAAFKEAADYIREQRFAMDRSIAKRLADHFEAVATENRKGEG